METRVALGIGDILLNAVYYHTYKLDLTLVFNSYIIEKYKGNSSEYEDFIKRLIKDLFPEEKVKFVRDNQENLNYFYNNYQTPQSLSLRHFFNLKPVDDNYTVVLTKVRIDGQNFRKEVFNRLPEICNRISCIDGKKILLGERTIKNTLEVSVHNIISMYDLLDKTKFVDMTQEELNSSPNYESFLRDISIIAGAKRCVGIGLGGNFCICLTFAERILFLNESPCSHHIVDDIARRNDPSQKITASIDDF